jgi:hypothetical protein
MFNGIINRTADALDGYCVGMAAADGLIRNDASLHADLATFGP